MPTPNRRPSSSPRLLTRGLVALGALLAPALMTAWADEPTPAQPATGDQPMPHRELIPREVLFGNPDRAATRISPNGKYISYTAPHNGVLNLWVAPVGDLAKARPVTSDTTRGIWSYYWAYTNNHILYRQDVGGDESWKVFCVDVEKALAGEENATRDLTPFDTIPGPDGKPLQRPGGGGLLRPAARIEGVSNQFPETILIGLNNRNPTFHDLYRVNILNGEMSLIYQNDIFGDLVVDDNFRVRFGMTYNDQGGRVYERFLDDRGEQTETWATISSEDSLTAAPLGFDATGDILYWGDSSGRDTAALFEVNMTTGDKRLLAENPRCDLSNVISHPKTGIAQAVSFEFDRTQWVILDESIKADFDYLKSVCDGEVNITSRTIDNTLWTVAFTVDNGPSRAYLYDRENKATTFLFTNRAELERYTLARMHPVTIPARDGLQLVSYLTLPVDSDSDHDARPNAPLPMIVNIHGGPWTRDSWGFHGEVQWMADRGYAVLQVNYRGSTGFGKAFINAANREWGGKMSDDILDAVQWAVNEKIADPARIAIYGGSYGGYATLVGMTRDADTFVCGVDIVGVSNLNTFLKTIPPYWAPFLEQMKVRLGDFTTDEGRAFLASRSPISHVEKITRPLLIGQGANDPRVHVNESEQIVKAMQEKKIPVTYVLYPDEGHGFARPENRLSFYAVAEAFLAQHMWGDKVGPFEPIGGDFKNSSIQIPAGAEQVPGVEGALKK